jgi:hypothetical protein
MDQRGGGGGGTWEEGVCEEADGGTHVIQRRRDGDDRARRRGGGDVWIGRFLPEDEAVALFRMAQAQIPFPVGSDVESVGLLGH